MQHVKRLLLFDNEEPWVKKQAENFGRDHDSAEVCEIVGFCLLSLHGEKYNNKEIGLYRDCPFSKNNGPEAEKIKKDKWNIFKKRV